MKLYEIKDELVETLDILLETSDDELAKENCLEMLDFLKVELKNKSDSLLKYLRNLTLEKEAVSNELERLEYLKKSKDNKIKKLKTYLVNIMLELDEKKIATDIGSYGLRRDTKVDIINENLIPKEFIKTKIEKTCDKIGIANYIKQFGEINGARLVESYSLQIR